MKHASPAGDEERDRRLGEAIDGYVALLDGGGAMSVTEWTAQHPEIADELAPCLDALLLLRGNSGQRALLGLADRLAPPHRSSHASSITVLPDDVPGYHVTGEIGRGGMGVVYKAVQLSTRRTVALKFLAQGAFASAAARRRFEREVELASALDHPGIVRVLDAGEVRSGLWCAMEFVEGEPLHRHLARAQLPIADVLALFLQIADAVHEAHLRAVVHRDLKPSNILVDASGRARVLDFGLARTLSRDADDREGSGWTREGEFVGTLPYLSPEQASGTPHAVDIRSDVYALGVILYEMTAGRLPYPTGPRLSDALRHIASTIPERPSKHRHGIGAGLDSIALKALEKEKGARYQTAAELAADVRAYLRGEPVEANRGAPFFLLRKAYARHRRTLQAALLLFAGLVVTSVLVLALYFKIREERNALAEQLHVSRLRASAAHLAAGHDMLAESMLLEAWKERKDPGARWSLVAYYAQNPLEALWTDTGWITALAFTGHERTLACGTLDGRLALRSLADGRTRGSIDAHAGGVRALVALAGGERLASGGADGRIRIFSARALEPIATELAHAGGLKILCASSDGSRLLSAGADGRLVLWKVNLAGIEIVWERTFSGAIEAADLSPRADLVAVALQHDDVMVIDAGTCDEIALVHLAQGTEALRFSPDGSWIAAWSSGRVSIALARTGSMAWTADAGLSEPRPTSLWDPPAGLDGAPRKPHECWQPALCFTSDGDVLIASGWDATVRAWDARSGRPRGELRAHETAVYALALEPGSALLAAGTVATVRVWDLARHPVLASRELAAGPERTCVAISPADVAWGGEPDGSVSCVPFERFTAREETRTLPMCARRVQALAFDGEGRVLAAADVAGGIALWDMSADRLLSRWETGDACIYALAFSPDGRRLASGGREGFVRVWSAAQSARGSEQYAWRAHAGVVLALGFSPDGTRLSSGGGDWRCKVWKLAEDGRAELLSERRHDEWVNALAFSPDGSQLASAGADLAILIGPVEGEPAVKLAHAHAHWINALAFLDQGRTIVSGGNDGALRFFDLSRAEELASLRSAGGPVHALALSRDERWLAVAASKAVQLIDLAAADRRLHR